MSKMVKKRENSLEEEIKNVSEKFLEDSRNKDIFVVSHFDTDGITSAAIMTKTLRNLDRNFSVKIIKSLSPEIIFDLPKDKIILFLDLASNALEYISEAGLENVYILDHHEFNSEIPNNVKIVNPELHKKEKVSASSVTYMFCKELSSDLKSCAKLAVLGMIGDYLDKEIGKVNNKILEEGEIQKKRGLTIYPSTKPINRVLEYSSSPFIPEVTGNKKGIIELLRDIGLKPEKGKYKSLIELNKDEMEKLVTEIMLRNPNVKHNELIGDIFLVKFFSKLEDAREISAKINACSRLGRSDVALQFCLELPSVKKKVENIYAKYKQEIISALKFASENKEIENQDVILINGKNDIKDTMAGTIASILVSSSLYKKGISIIVMAYYDNKIKVSARNNGSEKNMREFLEGIVEQIGGETGGHQRAAGANISKEKEKDFIELLKKKSEVEVVKVTAKNKDFKNSE